MKIFQLVFLLCLGISFFNSCEKSVLDFDLMPGESIMEDVLNSRSELDSGDTLIEMEGELRNSFLIRVDSLLDSDPEIATFHQESETELGHLKMELARVFRLTLAGNWYARIPFVKDGEVQAIYEISWLASSWRLQFWLGEMTSFFLENATMDAGLREHWNNSFEFDLSDSLTSMSFRNEDPVPSIEYVWNWEGNCDCYVSVYKLVPYFKESTSGVYRIFAGKYPVYSQECLVQIGPCPFGDDGVIIKVIGGNYVWEELDDFKDWVYWVYNNGGTPDNPPGGGGIGGDGGNGENNPPNIKDNQIIILRRGMISDMIFQYDLDISVIELEALIGADCDNAPDFENCVMSYEQQINALLEPNSDGMIDVIDFNNQSYNGDYNRIPNCLKFSDNSEINITFGRTSDHVNADQEVAECLIDALHFTLECAKEEFDIFDIHISSTTNGEHSKTSNHYWGGAMDISRINGVSINSMNEEQLAVVAKLQECLENYPGIRENFGPSLKKKLNQDYWVPGHQDHIHFSINSDTKNCNYNENEIQCN